MIRVLVADDHPVVRAGMRALLAAQEGLEVVGEAASGEEVLALCRKERPDVVLTDLRMGPGLDGVGVTRALRETDDPPAVLILTTYDTDGDIVRAVEAGAAGYLLKDAVPAVIVDAVRQAALGHTVLAPAVATRLVRAVREPGPALSARESEVLALVADGMTNQQIARRLVVSQATVKTHLVHVFDKLGVDNRTAAVTRAREAGLLP